MIYGLTVSTAGVENWFGLTWLTGTGFFVSKTFSLLATFAILASAAIDDSIERRPPFEEMEFEFLKFLLVDSY